MTMCHYDRMFLGSPLVQAFLAADGNAPGILPASRIGGAILFQREGYVVEQSLILYQDEWLRPLFPACVYLPCLMGGSLAFTRFPGLPSGPMVPFELRQTLAAMTDQVMVRYLPGSASPWWREVTGDEWSDATANFFAFRRVRRHGRNTIDLSKCWEPTGRDTSTNSG